MKNASKHNKKNRKKLHRVQNSSANGELVVQSQRKDKPITFLPEVVISPIFTVKKRFIASAACFGSITINDLCNQFMIATSAVLLNCTIKAFKIVKIAMLSPITTQGTSVTCSLSPSTDDTSSNSFTAVPEKYLDTSASIDVPAYLALKPSISTPLGSWHLSSNVNKTLIDVNAPKGTCMDITFAYILNDNFAPAVYTQAVAGATVGQFYSRNVLTNFIPQAYAVI